MNELVNTLNGLVWSPALIYLCLGVGLYFSLRGRFLQVRHFKEMIRLMFNGRDVQFNGEAVKLACRQAKSVRRDHMDVDVGRQRGECISHPGEQDAVDGEGSVVVGDDMVQLKIAKARYFYLDHGN